METWIEVTLATQATNRKYRIIAIFVIAIAIRDLMTTRLNFHAYMLVLGH